MGLLVEGVWRDQWYDTKSTGGKFKRQVSSFRNWITPDGSAGPTGKAGFKAEPGRYHLYVSLACPWAHRTLIFRQLKGLTDDISVDVVHYHMGENGWEFHATADGATPDTINARNRLYEVYLEADPSYTGRVTVPVLWDKQQNTIVNNESSEIIRMFNSAFDSVGAAQGDYYPAELREEIDSVNKTVYSAVNNGVYKAGFATSQEAYEDAFAALFDALDMLEAKLSKHRYLVGNTLSEADWRLFTTLVRFDPVYVGHFKCNKRRIADYPNLSNYVRDLYQVPGIEETVNLTHIKLHYYGSHATINPTGIVPLGPEIDYSLPHDRARFS
jgi:putative glutathione S-transferase